MTHRLLTTCVAAAAIAGGAAAGITSAVSMTASPSPAFQQVVFGTPLPLDTALAIPTADQITGVLNGLADPGIPFASKAYLVEGGIGRIEARTADALMKNAVAKGQLPLSFSVADITAVGPGAATANVTAAGPGMPPTTQNVMFIDQGGWKLSRTSASTVLSIFSG